MGTLLLIPLILIGGTIGTIAGMRRMLVIVGAVLMGIVVLSAPNYCTRHLQNLPVVLSPQILSLTSTVISFVALPVLAALLLRRLYTLLPLPWFLDRVLGAVLGGVAGTVVKHWLME